MNWIFLNVLPSFAEDMRGNMPSRLYLLFLPHNIYKIHCSSSLMHLWVTTRAQLWWQNSADGRLLSYLGKRNLNISESLKYFNIIPIPWAKTHHMSEDGLIGQNAGKFEPWICLFALFFLHWANPDEFGMVILSTDTD